ncbi:N-acetylglucosamine-1-phosphotransferase subunits alpha/beta-like isoform X2 [Panonychus citri]|nr:N-acetylglucosamine-1-phosphotransferase subunits alpha/beta-like isoform X2 [Panonychus citri]
MDTTLVAIDSSMDIKGLEMFKSIKSFETITSQSIGSQYYLLYLTKDEEKALVDYFKLHSNVNPVKPIYVHLNCSDFSSSNERLNLAESFVSKNIIYLSSTSSTGSILSSEMFSSLSSSLSPSSSSSSTYQWLPPRKQFLKLFSEREKNSIRNIVFHSSRRSALILLEPFVDHHDDLIDHLFSLGHRYNFTVTLSPLLYLGNEDLVECYDGKIAESINVNRFADNDEFKYSLRSVEKFSPWIRNVYLVTNGQIPDWLDVNNPRLRLITHEDIFPNKSDLPTFNSVAIEIHLHRIPGLSEKFLYFNDDIMLGKPVYLEDFYTPADGYKIYQAWPVPNCEPGCPASWLGDGFCDQACNTTLCLYDGGDCTNKTLTSSSLGGILSDHSNFRGGPSSFTASRPLTDQCRPSCADFWLGDKYCDNVCNHPDCAFDMGDCGLDGYSTIPGYPWSPHQRHYFYPSPTPSIYLNLTDLMSTPDFQLISASYSKNSQIRSVTINLKHQLLTILFSTNVTDIMMPIELRYKINKVSFDLNFELNVTSSNEVSYFRSDPVLVTASPETQMTVKTDLNILDSIPNDNSTIQVDPIIIFNLTSTDHNQSLIKIIDSENQNSSNQVKLGEDLTKLIESLSMGQFDQRPIGVYPWENEENFKKLGDLIANYEKYSTINDQSMVKTTQRQLLDIFSDSIKFVNHLYNRVFGIKARKIVAHSPILLDKSIIARLWEQFPEELSLTSSHKLRSSNDMQFSFSYFNFLMSETLPANYNQLIKQFDTDNSNKLSANELRSLLVNIVAPPIVPIVWSNYSDCWNGSDYNFLKQEGYEWTIDELLDCQKIVNSLDKMFSYIGKNRYTLMSDSEVSFTMIRGNSGQLINKLDGLRRDPKKFLCFNDDIQNDESNETKLIRSSLTDYYQYLVPKRSSFELADNSVNRFENISAYRLWKQSRQLRLNSLDQSSTWFYFLLYGLILFLIIFKVLNYISTRSRVDYINIIRV